MQKKADLSLYFILDLDFCKALKKNWQKTLESALKGGATTVQLRSKSATAAKMAAAAAKAKKICLKYGIPLIINDKVYVSKKIRADGAHVGRSDMAVKKARKILGKTALVGTSASTLKEALEADTEGADYIGIGPVFPTATKNALPMKKADVAAAPGKIKTPLVAIGGIKECNIKILKKMGYKNFAFISEIISAADIAAKVKRIKKII